jgi:hypothetical protein
MARLTATQAEIINNMNPTAQAVSLGTSLKEDQDYGVIAIQAAVTANASTAIVSFVAPYAMLIFDIIVRATVTEGSGTLQPLKGTNAMCTAIACATDGTVSRLAAGAVVANDARLTLAAGDTVNILAAGGTAANIRGIVTYLAIRI